MKTLEELNEQIEETEERLEILEEKRTNKTLEPFEWDDLKFLKKKLEVLEEEFLRIRRR